MKDVLKLALEALQLVSIEFVCNGAHHAKKDRHDWLESCPIVERYQAAITAIKEALAQPKQKPVAADLEVRRPNGPWQRYNVYSSVAVAKDAMKRIEGAPIEVRVLPLYTTPPKRPWVGLTEDEMSEIAAQGHQRWKEHAQAIEAKLKEKNT